MRPAATAIPNPFLRQAREARGWTQEQVADQIGTSGFTVCRWERGLTTPGPHYRQQLCALFQLSPEALGLLRATGTPITPGNSLLSVAEQQPLQSPAAPAALSVDASRFLPAPLVPPAPSRHLIGREGLLAALKQRLSTTPPFLAIRGLPGVGKTALALGLAHDPALRDLFPDGVLWVSVGPHPPLLAHLQRWGRALGWSTADLAPLQDPAALAKALQASIGHRQLLLVMDDLWQVEDALALKIGGPRCTHLATTRLPLIAHHLAAEHTLAVPELDDDDSLALLQCLAPASTAAYPDDLRSLVRQVGGLPLALQLIGHALRVQELSGQPRRIARAIQALQQAEARLRLSEASAPTDTPPALQAGMPLSLEAVITVSVQELTPRAQTLLHALAVFPAKPISFSEEAALGVSGLERPDCLDGLDALLDAGLVESVGPARYTLHPTIADFARLTNPHLRQAQERYVRYYAALAQACRDDYPRLEEAFQPLIAALQLAYDLQLWDALISAVVAFAPFGLARGFYTLLATHLTQALEGAERLPDEQNRCNLLNALSAVSERQGAYAASQAYAEQALVLARQVHSLHATGKALHLLGVVSLHTGNNARAQECLEAGLALASTSGDDELSIQILTTLTRLMHTTGNYPQTEAFAQQGLALARKHQRHEWMIGFLGNLGVLHGVQGHYAKAERYITEALAEVRLVGDRERIALWLTNLGVVALEQGHLEKAEGLLLESLTVARDLGSRERVIGSLINLGELALARQRYEQAEGYVQEGLLLAREIGHTDRLAAILYVAGLIACRQQHYAQAQAFQEEGIAIARTTGHQRHICQLLLLAGECALYQGQLADATAAFQETLALADSKQYRDLKGEALFGLAQTRQCQGETAQAHRQGLESFQLLHAIQHGRASEVQRWLETLTEGRKQQHPSVTP